jgi:hypothetical protein
LMGRARQFTNTLTLHLTWKLLSLRGGLGVHNNYFI